LARARFDRLSVTLLLGKRHLTDPGESGGSNMLMLLRGFDRRLQWRHVELVETRRHAQALGQPWPASPFDKLRVTLLGQFR
jgi:hypothetical protein